VGCPFSSLASQFHQLFLSYGLITGTTAALGCLFSSLASQLHQLFLSQGLMTGTTAALD